MKTLEEYFTHVRQLIQGATLIAGGSAISMTDRIVLVLVTIAIALAALVIEPPDEKR